MVTQANPLKITADKIKLLTPHERAMVELAKKRGLIPDVAAQAGHPAKGSELPWREWVETHFSYLTESPFAPRHEKLWDWFEALTPGVRPKPRVEVWARGGAKSSSAELGTARVGVKLNRRFVLYVSGTQGTADKHVQDIAANFLECGIGRAITKYGASKGWRRDQLSTENGFFVTALGLDVVVRGIKIEGHRPDLIIFDDIDGLEDTPALTAKKIARITSSILPAGSPDCAILFIQNEIIHDGIVSQLVRGKADFLLDREIGTFEPAVNDLVMEHLIRPDGTAYYVITGGTATWEGQNLEVCQNQINSWGRRAFLQESQHMTSLSEDGLWDRKRDIDSFRVDKVPVPLIAVCVGIDPSATSGGDEAGVIVAGIGLVDGIKHAFVLADVSIQGSPQAWAKAAVEAYIKHHGRVLVAESNNGGEMVAVTIGTIPNAPRVKLLHASRGKLTRAEPVQKLYEDGRIHHVGSFSKLEQEMCTWQPGDPSPNRMDALVWAITELMLGAAENRINRKKGGARRKYGFA